MKKVLPVLTVLVVLCVLVHSWLWIPGEPVIYTDDYKALVKELGRSDVAVLLPPEEAFSGEEVTAYVDVRGRTRLSDVGGYHVGWNEGTERKYIDCYIPYPDEREVPGLPGYVTHGNGSTYWEAPPPIRPNHKIGTVGVEVTELRWSSDWQARFETSGCRYTIRCGTEESVLALCRLLLNLSADSDKATAADYSIKEAYQYEVVPGTSEWEALPGKEERLKACWVDSAILEQMTTEALVETILTYPFFVDVFAFDTLELGFSMAPPQGLSILLERKDAVTVTEAAEKARLNEYGSNSVEWLYAHALQEYLSQRDISSS